MAINGKSTAGALFNAICRGTGTPSRHGCLTKLRWFASLENVEWYSQPDSSSDVFSAIPTTEKRKMRVKQVRPRRSRRLAEPVSHSASCSERGGTHNTASKLTAEYRDRLRKWCITPSTCDIDKPQPHPLTLGALQRPPAFKEVDKLNNQFNVPLPLSPSTYTVRRTHQPRSTTDIFSSPRSTVLQKPRPPPPPTDMPKTQTGLFRKTPPKGYRYGYSRK